MHSCIAALSQGVPCVRVAYSRKFEGGFESVGVKDWVVDGRSIGVMDTVAMIMRRYHARHEVRAGLTARARDARRCLEDLFAGSLRLVK